MELGPDELLRTAIDLSNVGLAKRAVACGASLELEDDVGWTPLFYAVAAQDREMIAYLLAAGANPNHVDALALTAEMHARVDGDYDLAGYLRQSRALM